MANQDQHLREARALLDRMMNDMPGYSETLPPQRVSFGEPIWRKRGLSTTSDRDFVEKEHTRIILETGYGIRPPDAIRNGLDLRDVTLSDGRNAYDVYRELVADSPGKKSLKKSLARLIESNSYQNLVDDDPKLKGTKLGLISKVASKYRTAAWWRLLKQYPE